MLHFDIVKLHSFQESFVAKLKLPEKSKKKSPKAGTLGQNQRAIE